MEDYEVIGKCLTRGAEVLFQPGYIDIGVSYGVVYKNWRAFKESPDEVCYIPEYAFQDADYEVEVDGEKFYAVSGYTRHDLEELLKDEVDGEGELIDIEYFFDELIWAFPETYLIEMTY